MARRGVVSGGGIMIDVNKIIDRYPPRDHVAVILAESTDTGGPGLNMATNLARLGAPFPIEEVGLVGDDAHGRQLRATCEGLGIGTAGIQVRADLRTSYTDVMIERTGGRRTFFHAKGANTELTPDLFDFGRTGAKILHLGAPGGGGGLDRPQPRGNGFAEVFAAARAAGLQTNLEMHCLELDRLRELVLPCLPLLDSIIINEVEAAAVTGIDAGRESGIDWPTAEVAARELVTLGIGRLAVIHFPEGCVAAAPGGRVWRQGRVRVPAADIVSANGAGDAFASGVLLGLHEDWPVERSLALGAATAAICLRSSSSSGGVRPIAECLAYADRHGFAEAG